MSPKIEVNSDDLVSDDFVWLTLRRYFGAKKLHRKKFPKVREDIEEYLRINDFV